jgi:hypothetical protein
MYIFIYLQVCLLQNLIWSVRNVLAYKHGARVLGIHQQNAQITNKVQSALYHNQILHMFRLSMSHHQGFFNSAFQMLDRSANDTCKVLHCL